MTKRNETKRIGWMDMKVFKKLASAVFLSGPRLLGKLGAPLNTTPQVRV